MERTQEWLENKLNNIWEALFPEVKKENSVIIKFSGKSKYRLGYIKLRNNTSFIVLNALFQSSLVPEYIIDTTVAHELVHYMHGFNSPLPQKYRYPHQGGIVTKELIKRGFANSLKLEKKWIKESWLKVHKLLTQ